MAVALTSCVKPATALVVRIESDLTPRAELSSVRVRVRREGETTPRFDRVYDLAGRFSVPGDVSLTPEDPSDARRLDIEVIAELAGGGQIAREFRTSFVLDRTMMLEVYLARRCGPPFAGCSTATTCGRAECEPVDDPALAAFSPLAADAGADAPPEGPCPARMVLLPEGVFQMGSLAGVGSRDEEPAHPVHLSAFCIDRSEVTVLQYRQCAGCSAPVPLPDPVAYCNWGAVGRDDQPINCVTWSQAVAYCESVGGRLPTEAEWEYAARGATQRRFPWGNEAPEGRLCWNGEGTLHDRTCAIGSYPGGDSPDGLHDLAGNVSEWTADWMGP